MSISRSQAQALSEGLWLDLGSKPPTGRLEIIDAMLSLAAKRFIDTASDNLNKADAVDTGDLRTDLIFEVETSGNLYQMSVGYEAGGKASKYWDFVNKGVQGVKKGGKAPKSPYKFRFLGVSKKHAAAMEGWIRRSGISATNISAKHPASGLEAKRVTLRDSVQKDPIKSLAYAMAFAAKREGMRPTGYFDNAVKDTLGPSFIEALEVALGGEVIVSIRQAQL